MGYSKGDFVNVKDNPLLHIIVAFNNDGSVKVQPAGSNADSQRIVSFDTLVKQTRRANITPYQRGLLRAIKYSSIPAWMYRHMRPSSKRSVNCLIRKGFVELFDDTEFTSNGTEVNGQGVRVTWAGRRVDTSDNHV